MATVLSAVSHLRKYILKDTGGSSGVDWTTITEGTANSTLLLWSNEELTAYINEAQIQAFRRCLLQEDYGPLYDIPVIPGVDVYTLHPKIIQVIANILDSNGKTLELTDMRTLFNLQNWNKDTGIPKFYSMNYKTNTVVLYPIPTTNYTLSTITPTFATTASFTVVGDQTSTFITGRLVQATVTAGYAYGTVSTAVYATGTTTVTLTMTSGVLDSGLTTLYLGDVWHPLVYRLPLTTLSWTSNTTPLEILDQFTIPMLSYAAYLAYMKQDADTYDPKQAMLYSKLFDDEFGVTSVYSDTRKLKSADNAVKYGGIRFNSGGPRPPVRIVRNSNG